MSAGGPALRIAMLSYGLPSPGKKRGGIERVAHDLADGLARRGHAVTVFSHDAAPAGAAYGVVPLPWSRFVDTWLGRRVTMGYLGNVLMLLPGTAAFDVTVAHGDSLLLPLKRQPFLRVLHGSAWEEARSARTPGRFVLQSGVYVQELLSAATHRWVVAVSENTRRGNPFVRRVIPNGVNRGVFRPDPRDRAPEPTLLFVGALAGRKRGAWLLERFASQIRPRVPAARLHMVCTPGAPQPGVTYHVGIPDHELAGLYRRAWVYASPSAYEGFGLPYAEALACGTPVVATPNPGSREVLEGGAGGVLADDEAFGNAVVDLLLDERRRERLALAGGPRVETYDLSRTIDAYEAVLRELAATRRLRHD